MGLNERLIDEGHGKDQSKANSEGKTLWGRSWKLDDSTWCVWVLLEFSLSKAAFFVRLDGRSFLSVLYNNTYLGLITGQGLGSIELPARRSNLVR